MCYRCLGGVLVAFAFTATLSAQGVTSAVIPEQSVTTGMVGFTANQTARLNVLNLNSLLVPSATGSTTPSYPNCNVQLAFYDNKNVLISQTTVVNFAPGMATFWDLPRTTVTSETAARAEIRGVVTVNPTPTPAGSPATIGYCTVFTTLEIYDSTGSTISLTSDTRSTRLPIAIPVAVDHN